MRTHEPRAGHFFAARFSPRPDKHAAISVDRLKPHETRLRLFPLLRQPAMPGHNEFAKARNGDSTRGRVRTRQALQTSQPRTRHTRNSMANEIPLDQVPPHAKSTAGIRAGSHEHKDSLPTFPSPAPTLNFVQPLSAVG